MFAIAQENSYDTVKAPNILTERRRLSILREDVYLDCTLRNSGLIHLTSRNASARVSATRKRSFQISTHRSIWSNTLASIPLTLRRSCRDKCSRMRQGGEKVHNALPISISRSLWKERDRRQLTFNQHFKRSSECNW